MVINIYMYIYVRIHYLLDLQLLSKFLELFLRWPFPSVPIVLVWFFSSSFIISLLLLRATLCLRPWACTRDFAGNTGGELTLGLIKVAGLNKLKPRDWWRRCKFLAGDCWTATAAKQRAALPVRISFGSPRGGGPFFQRDWWRPVPLDGGSIRLKVATEWAVSDVLSCNLRIGNLGLSRERREEWRVKMSSTISTCPRTLPRAWLKPC